MYPFLLIYQALGKLWVMKMKHIIDILNATIIQVNTPKTKNSIINNAPFGMCSTVKYGDTPPAEPMEFDAGTFEVFDHLTGIATAVAIIAEWEKTAADFTVGKNVSCNNNLYAAFSCTFELHNKLVCFWMVGKDHRHHVYVALGGAGGSGGLFDIFGGEE